MAPSIPVQKLGVFLLIFFFAMSNALASRSGTQSMACRRNKGSVITDETDRNCRRFLSCDMSGKVANVFRCPSGTRFNPVIKTCDNENNVPCGERGGKKLIGNDQKSLCHSQPSGYLVRNFADATCSTFQVCLGNGKSVVKKCPAGLRFNPSCKCCDHAANVRCSGAPTRRPSTRPRPTSRPTRRPSTTKPNRPTPRPNAIPSPTPGSKGGCTNRPTGTVLANPADTTCRSFLICKDGAAIAKRCPQGLVFNPACTCCDWPGNSVCDPTADGPPLPEATTYRPARTTRRPANTRPTRRPTMSPPSTSNSCGKKVVCYYPNWAHWRQGEGKFGISDIDPSLCTHVVYAFAVIDPATMGLKAHDAYLDLDDGLGNFRKFVTDLKSRRPDVRLLLAVGGWTDSQNNAHVYKKMMGSAANRKKFVRSALDMIEEYGFDGLDLDYEFPDAADRTNFASWVSDLRAEFGTRGLELTAAVSANPSKIRSGLDVPSISRDLDAIHVMSYDFHGSWERNADHHSKLRSDNDELNSDNAIKTLMKLGAPAAKLVLGIPTYGRSFTVAAKGNYRPPLSSIGAGQAGSITKAAGSLGYNEICQKIATDSWTEVNDVKNGPYAYKGDQWVGYDTPDSAAAKAEYVERMGLGGAMIWDLATDDFKGSCGKGRYPILTAINSALQTSRCDP